MEHYDVAIIGGGSAGLAALKRLSDLNKQAILIQLLLINILMNKNLIDYSVKLARPNFYNAMNLK